MTRHVDADKILLHLNDEIEACSDPDVYSQPVAYGTYLGLQHARSIVETAETADVQEVRHGRWISNELTWYRLAYYCSECGWVDEYAFNERHKYCPNCGTKMDSDEK